MPYLPQEFIERLSGQINRFHVGLERLAKAFTLTEMTRIFSDILDENLQGAEISIFHLPSSEEVWSSLCEKGEDIPAETFPISEREFAFRYLDDSRTTMAILQPLVDKSSLGVTLQRKPPKPPFTGADRVSLQLFLQLFANAYETLVHRRNEKDLVFSLNHRVLQLKSLIDTGIELSKLKQEGSLQQLALERAASLTNSSRGLLIVSVRDVETERHTFPEGETEFTRVNNGHRIHTSVKFLDTTFTFELFEKESRNGIVEFDETDQMLLDALARQVQASLENRHSLQQALEMQKIEQNLAVAASIQKRIIPKSLPAIEGYDICGINLPSKSVGGDYYDCIPLADGRILLVIADVSGKDIPAALLVSSFHAYLAGYLEGTYSLVQLVQRLSKAIYRASTDDKFVTAFLAMLDPKTGKLESVSAGHNPVYFLRRDGQLTELSNGGVALGMIDIEFPYERDEVVIERGDRLLLYTDGVTEAVNEQNELYDSFAPLHQFVRQHKDSSAKEFIDSLVSDINRFSGAAPQADDITALYLVRI